MTEPRQMSGILVGIALVLIALILGAAYYVERNRETVGRWYLGDVIEQEKRPLEERVKELEAQVDSLRYDLAGFEPQIPPERIEEVFGTGGTPEGKDGVRDECRELKGRVERFFAYLGSRDYVGESDRHGGLEPRIRQALSRALDHLPVVARETDSLTRFFNNTVHFFRVLGKDDTLLIRDILDRERDVVEPMMALAFEVYQTGSQCTDRDLFPTIPRKAAYEYGAYFLHTLGGRSYLFRRSPRVRNLVRYYAIRIVDEANRLQLNEYGLDLRDDVDRLIQDLESSTNLADRSLYLETLRKIKERYRTLYGN